MLSATSSNSVLICFVGASDISLDAWAGFKEVLDAMTRAVDAQEALDTRAFSDAAGAVDRGVEALKSALEATRNTKGYPIDESLRSVLVPVLTEISTEINEHGIHASITGHLRAIANTLAF